VSSGPTNKKLLEERKYLRARVSLLSRAVYYKANVSAATIPWAGPWNQWVKIGEKEFYAEQTFPVDQVLVREPSE